MSVLPLRPLSLAPIQPVNLTIPPATAIAGWIDPEDVPWALNRILESRERIAHDREITARYATDARVDMARIQADALVRVKENESDTMVRLRQMESRTRLQESRHALSASIVNAVMSRALPREVSSISWTEREGRWWNSYDYRFELNIT